MKPITEKIRAKIWNGNNRYAYIGQRDKIESVLPPNLDDKMAERYTRTWYEDLPEEIKEHIKPQLDSFYEHVLSKQESLE